MLLAYNTNGLAHHHLIDSIELLAEIGYQGISITLDRGALDPFDGSLETNLQKVEIALKAHHFRTAIETGARFLLDPRNKHEPTLISSEPEGRARRVDFLVKSIDIAARLNADCVSLWSGIVCDKAPRNVAFSRLIEGLSAVLSIAESRGVTLAFEPEPGMLINTLDSYAELLDRLSKISIDSSRLRLTLDIGHLHCQGEVPIAEKIRCWSPRLANVHIEDMRSRVHEHLMFGEGEIDFPPVIAALAQIGYDGLVSVELSRHSHMGPDAARAAYNYLRPVMNAACAHR
jgi:L-ribulose-5-phosphate 3-epimerase